VVWRTRAFAGSPCSRYGQFVICAAQKRLAENNDDAGLMAHAIELERALAAIKLGLPEMPDEELAD
jgi:hypothetical protein